MEKQGVPMNQFPQSPDIHAQQQPPVYHQDANQPQFQQNAMYAQPQQQSYTGSPPPQQNQSGYIQPQPGQPQQAPHNPGMPPQQQSGTVYQTVTPIANLNRSPAPVDCPACGQRAMTNVAYKTGNTVHAWALGVCCVTGFGCIPYFVTSLKDVQHKCGRCGVLLATWHRSGTTEVHIHS
ncbi:hypothetical protein K504DRAFT_499410 [Pleomassaria siparia CBS 279.74]|uniref:LITAF domain-containing protein n=1 Tax=Pleomassaria siparia CBS 279.74 TaxID=1314801 RepID=A0A6G1KIW9_9PLEO|nr:hypothetical protein K504DRAFT_499410 [Pleomassaria siparia CBS 279.74]